MIHFSATSGQANGIAQLALDKETLFRCVSAHSEKFYACVVGLGFLFNFPISISVLSHVCIIPHCLQIDIETTKLPPRKLAKEKVNQVIKVHMY